MKKYWMLLLLGLTSGSAVWATATKQEITSPPIPEKLEFAGERVPLEDNDVYERLEREILSNTYFHSKTLSILKKVKRWQPEVNKFLEKDSVPSDFFYLAIAESGLDNTAGSPAGAKGMWQFLASTGQRYGLEVNAYVDQRKDPVMATKAAAAYLRNLHKMFGNWTSAAAAYNRGENGLKNALESQKVDSYYDLYLNDETYRYVFRILAYKIIIENPSAYGFVVDDEEKYDPFEFEELEIDSSIVDLPQFALEHKTNYKMLRKYNPWLDPNARYELPVADNRKYVIRIPKEKS